MFMATSCAARIASQASRVNTIDQREFTDIAITSGA
jgi:hypothetical protein